MSEKSVAWVQKFKLEVGVNHGIEENIALAMAEMHVLCLLNN